MLGTTLSNNTIFLAIYTNTQIGEFEVPLWYSNENNPLALGSMELEQWREISLNIGT
jgi:hypothetical protein